MKRLRRAQRSLKRAFLKDAPLRLNAFKQDILTVFKHGLGAPTYAEELWITPEQCYKFIPLEALREAGLRPELKMRGNTGQISTKTWPVSKSVCIKSALSPEFPISEYPSHLPSEYISCFKFRACHNHWVNGFSWEETGIFDFLAFVISEYNRPIDHGCLTRKDLEKRYEMLDRTFEEIQRSGRFKTQRELDSRTFRGRKNIYVHIGPDGEIFWGQGSQHRFAIAHILNLPFPGQLGMTHVTGLRMLKHLRTQSRQFA